MARILCLFLLAAMVVVPTVDAKFSGKATMAFNTPGKVDVDMTLSTTGQEAADFRAGIDGNGNGDGTVTTDEVDAVEDLMGDSFGEEEMFGENFTIDGKPPNTEALEDFNIRDAEGSITSTAAVRFEFVIKVEFPVRAGASHDVFISGGEEESDEDMEMTGFKITLPTGYVVKSGWVPPEGFSVTPDRKRIDVDPETEYEGNLEFTMVKSQPTTTTPRRTTAAAEEAPGLAGLAAILALGLVGLVRRQK